MEMSKHSWVLNHNTTLSLQMCWAESVTMGDRKIPELHSFTSGSLDTPANVRWFEFYFSILLWCEINKHSVKSYFKSFIWISSDTSLRQMARFYSGLFVWDGAL